MLAMFIRLKTCPFSLGRRLEFHIGRLDLLEKRMRWPGGKKCNHI